VNQTTFHSYGSVDWENSTTQAATAERTDHFTVVMTTSNVTAEFPHLTTVAGSGIVTTALRGSTEFTSTSPVETTRPPVTTTIPDETSTVLPVTTTILHSTTTGVIGFGHVPNSQTGTDSMHYRVSLYDMSKLRRPKLIVALVLLLLVVVTMYDGVVGPDRGGGG